MQVSEIGLGTAQLSNTDGHFQGVKYVSPEVAQKVLRVAVEGGVNFFDTGDQYGHTEVLLGELSSSHKGTMTIATKAGLRSDGIRDFSEAYLRQQLDRSLKRLRVDCVDLFQLNKPSKNALEDGRLFSMLGDLKTAGKIRLAGVVVGEIDTGDMCVKSGHIDCLQVMYHLLYGQTEDLILRAGQLGMGVIVRSPLNSGVLSGAYTSRMTFPAVDERSRYFSGRLFEERLDALQGIQGALGVQDHDLLEFSLRYVLSNPHVSVVIPGASSVEQVVRYMACSNLDRFAPAELARIKEVVFHYMQGARQVFQN